jgi:peptidoglycan/LPS O-acetylase OafA/YrhL
VSYRPDIDGLRALAVLAVVLFHIDADLLPGGFAGVDIFFVISGFLITGNILRDIDSEKGFSWLEFYRRRILRLLPVLFVVLLTTLIFGHFILIPEDFREMSYAAIASIASAANVYFTYFLNTDYFAEASHVRPLLHLWSLGVEEQFYVFWPIILVSVLSFAGRWPLILVTLVIASGSFLLAESLLHTQPKFAYYMLPTRGGELLIGALLAIWIRDRDMSRIPEAVWALSGATGLLLVFFSLIWVSEDKGFPGLNALPSTLGAALIILGGSGGPGLVARILARPVLVWIGLISYSLYLWHWPILAFYRYAYGPVDVLTGAWLFVLMLLMSYASYRFVEQPCRRLRWSFPSVIFRGVAPGSLALMVLCGCIVLTKGYGLYALDSAYVQALDRIKPAPPAYAYSYVCQTYRLTHEALSGAKCVVNSDQDPKVLLWGDSHAAHYVGVLGALAEKLGFGFRNAAHSACPPLLEGAELVVPEHRLRDCLDSLSVVRSHLDRYSTIVIAGAWGEYQRRNSDFMALLEDTIDSLVDSGKRVLVLGQVPSFRNVDRKCQQKALKALVRGCEGEGQSLATSSQPGINRTLRALVEKRWPDVYYFDVGEAICSGDVCSSSIDDMLVYYDNGHLSMDGSWLVGRTIAGREDVPGFLSAVLGP